MMHARPTAGMPVVPPVPIGVYSFFAPNTARFVLCFVIRDKNADMTIEEKSMLTRHHLAAGLTMAALGLSVPPLQAVAAQPTDTVQLNLPAQPLDRAITDLGTQTGLVIGGDAALLRGKQAAQLNGSFTVEQALRELLADSGVEARFDGQGGVTLVRAPVPQGALGLPTITVTGERVDRSFLDTQTSVYVLDEEAVRNADARTVLEAVRSAPNLTPNSAQGLPTIRGVDSDGPLALGGNDLNGTTPRASLIVDDVARTTSYANNGFQALYDVEQVEVLRGPQTTLRGANAIAGAFVVKTRDPVFDNEADLTGALEYDDIGEWYYRLGAMGNPVLVDDELAARIVLEYEDGEIPVDFIPPGFTEVQDSQSEFDRFSARGKLLWEPKSMPALSALLQLDYQEARDTGFDANISGQGSGVNPNDRLNVFAQRIFDTEAYAVKLDVGYEAGPGEWRSITSFADEHYETNPDATEIFVGFDDINEERFVQDVTYSFEDWGRVDGIMGLTYQKIDKFFDYGLAFDFDSDSERETMAAFADLTVAMTDRLDLIVGGRLQNETNTFTTTLNAFGNNAVVDYDETVTVFLPKIGFSYAVTDTQRIVSTIRRGYNGGGAGVNFFTGIPFEFDGEYATTFEIGYRGDLADGRVLLSATAFYNDYKDYQLYDSDPNNPIDYTIFNANGQSWGAEVELDARVSETVRANLGIGLLKTRIDEPGERFDGNSFGRAPNLTLSGGIAWEARPGLTFDARASYIGKYFSDFEEIPGEEAGDYVNVDLGVAYEIGSVTTRAYVRNLFDELQYVTRGVSGGGQVLDPRTFGITASVRF